MFSSTCIVYSLIFSHWNQKSFPTQHPNIHLLTSVWSPAVLASPKRNPKRNLNPDGSGGKCNTISQFNATYARRMNFMPFVSHSKASKEICSPTGINRIPMKYRQSHSDLLVMANKAKIPEWWLPIFDLTSWM